MKKRKLFRIALRAKLIVFFLFWGIIMLSGALFSILLLIAGMLIDNYSDMFKGMSKITMLNLNLSAADIEQYAQKLETDSNYEQAKSQLYKCRTSCSLESCYIIYIVNEQEAIYVMDSMDNSADEEQLGNPVMNYTKPSWDYFRNYYRIEGNTDELLDISDNTSDVISFYHPIPSENGEINIFLILEQPIADFVGNMDFQYTSVSVIALTFSILLGILLLNIFAAITIIRPIRKIKNGVQQMADGRLDVQISCRKRDEFGEIAQVFNRMASNINRHMTEMTELNQAYQKFIPSAFFNILHKDSIVDVRLGDQAEVRLTILTMQPQKARQKLSDSSSDQIFRYINSIHAVTVPAVLQNNGSVWQFEKARICSIYDASPKNALDSALETGRLLNKIDEQLSAGITSGPVMVGIAGHRERMNIISISEQAKIADFLVEISEYYSASILITKNAAMQIPGFQENYHSRFLGCIRITQSNRLEGVYDVFDNDALQTNRQKQQTKTLFEQGVTFFMQEDFKKARTFFIDVLRLCPSDGAARKYLELCNKAADHIKGSVHPWFSEMRR